MMAPTRLNDFVTGLTNFLSKDKIEILDCDDFAKFINEISHQQELLQNQLSDIKLEIESCLLLIHADSAHKISDLADDSNKDKYTLTESNNLHKWSKLQNVISLHCLLGLECHSLPKNGCNFTIHCYEDKYPNLPCKIFKMDHVQGTVFYKMKPKEISYHMECNERIRSFMMKSTREEMIECVQYTQSNIFDLVLYDNIYQKICSLTSLSYSFSFHRNMETISLTLPINWKRDDMQNNVFVNLTEILPDYLTVNLYTPTKQANYNWTTDITHNTDEEVEVPRAIALQINSFIQDFDNHDVLHSVKKLLQGFAVQRLVQSPVSSSGTANSNNSDIDNFL